ncbi:kinesin-like protein KIN-14K isoform X2 [Apium graveolens]|uniref:kinesin-like protein KIN-14K isoform X2 n=1 Tax=Apium graveolens TaxID=4045 RepID=UPI003D7B2A6A
MQRAALIEWINTTLSNVKLPVHSSDDELRALLLDGSVLCRLLNKLRPGSVSELRGSDHPSKLGVENVGRFLVAIDQMAFPRFQVHDLQKGSKPIVDPYGLSDSSPCGENYIPTILEEQKRKGSSNSQYQHADLNPIMSLLFSERVACLLRKVIQEIERRMSTQAEHIRTQNNLFRAREERYQSRIRVLEALASGTNEEAQVTQEELMVLLLSVVEALGPFVISLLCFFQRLICFCVILHV